MHDCSFVKPESYVVLLRFFRLICSGRNLSDEFVRKVIERHFVDFRRISFLIQTHYAFIRVVNLFTRMRKEHGTGRQRIKIVSNKFRKLMRIVSTIFQKSRFLILSQVCQVLNGGDVDGRVRKIDRHAK